MRAPSARAARLVLGLFTGAALCGLSRSQDPAKIGDPLLKPEEGLELTLESAIEIALKRNLGLQIEALSTEIAFANYKGSWGAFDWTLTSRAGYRDSKFEGQDIVEGSSEINEDSQEFSVDFTRPLTTGGTFGAHFDTVNLSTNNPGQLQDVSTTDIVSLSYVQPLLRGAWREYATSLQREAHLDYRRQSEHERQVSEQLILDVSHAYWDLVAAREQLSVSESSVNLAKQQVDQNQRRLEAGVGTEVEVLQAEAEVASREERRLLFEVRVRQAVDFLKELMYPGKDVVLWDTSIVPSTPLPENVSADLAPQWTDALDVAIEKRTELVQQRLVIDGSEVRYERSRSNTLPTLDLDLGASSRGFSGDSSDAFDKAINYDFPTYTAALNFNFPLSNTTARYAEKSAWASLRQARLVYDQLESRVATEVREAVRQVVYQAEAVRAALKSLELARRQLQAEQARYQEGLSTTFQVLQFQQDLAQAMFSERQARANYAKALVSLASAQGLLGESLVR